MVISWRITKLSQFDIAHVFYISNDIFLSSIHLLLLHYLCQFLTPIVAPPVEKFACLYASLLHQPSPPDYSLHLNTHTHTHRWHQRSGSAPLQEPEEEVPTHDVLPPDAAAPRGRLLRHGPQRGPQWEVGGHQQDLQHQDVSGTDRTAS